MLLAILLRAPADWLTGKTGIAGEWSLAAVGLALLGDLGRRVPVRARSRGATQAAMYVEGLVHLVARPIAGGERRRS